MITTSAYSGYDDQALLKCLKESDKHAFTEIYNRYHKDIYRYLLSIVKLEEQAEDLLHEVYIKLWESRETIFIKGSFKSYLFRISHNKAIDALRKMVKDRKLQAAILRTFEKPDTFSYHSLEELHHYDSLIEKSLDELSPQRRRVYELCRLKGKTYKEAASELGIAPSTVKEHMTKALSTLRRVIQNRNELILILILLGNTL